MAAVLAVLLVGACGTPSDGPASAQGEPVERQRRPVSLEGSEVVLVRANELSIDVPSCNGDPEVTELLEAPDAVRFEVVTTEAVDGSRDDCLDGLLVVLEKPLGGRAVIDLVSGTVLAMVDQTEVQECSDIDLPLEPTFDTPEEALADVLREPPSGGTVPDNVEDYVRHDREGQVFFEHIVDDHHVLYTWGVARDDDGRWGVVSLGGCF